MTKESVNEQWPSVVMYYTPGQFFKIATGCLVHHYSPFDGNYTLENLYGQFDVNYTLENLEQISILGVPEHFFHILDFITWCEQASSAAQACKE